MAGMLADRRSEPGLLEALRRALDEEAEAEDELALTQAEGRFHRAIRQFRRRFMMNPDDFLRVRRVHRHQLVAGRDPFAADAQLVFASKLGAHFGES